MIVICSYFLSTVGIFGGEITANKEWSTVCIELARAIASNQTSAGKGKRLQITRFNEL